MRGKRFALAKISMLVRITPADAGKTIAASNISPSVQDHPRGCGENYTVTALYTGERRITPADAGKTVRLDDIFEKIMDHPRGCGENYPASSRRQTKGGSPPRMRGKRQRTARV